MNFFLMQFLRVHEGHSFHVYLMRHIIHMPRAYVQYFNNNKKENCTLHPCVRVGIILHICTFYVVALLEALLFNIVAIIQNVQT